MTEIAEKLKGELSQLSLGDRAELAYFLLNSLDEAADEAVEAAWEPVLARRMEEISRGVASSEPASRVFTELREKYS